MYKVQLWVVTDSKNNEIPNPLESESDNEIE